MSYRTHTLRRGATEQKVLVSATTPGGSPATGLSHDSPGLSAGFARDDGAKGVIALGPIEAGEWLPGGFREVDAAIAPGIYEFCVPDEVIAEGAARAVVVFQMPGAALEPVDFDIVAFDPQDDERIGMEALAFEQRVRCLTTAFPLLAAEERRRVTAEEQSG